LSNFDSAFERILKFEGGLTNDVGGITKYGISQKAYPNLDIKNITVDQAKYIYYNDYWKPLKLDEVLNDETAAHLFDIAVNTGKSRAVRMAQDTLNELGFNLTSDGIMGSKTLHAINGSSPSSFNTILKNKRIKFYNDLALRSDTYKKYLKGWIKRANSFGGAVTIGLSSLILISFLFYLTMKGKSGLWV